jgi:flotillin
MGRIDQLTVLSNDGASELVRNTTRTVTEASATVKGLTGIDVPALIGTSMGARFGGNGAPPPAGPGASGPKGGSGATGSSGGGGAKPTSARARREPPASRPAVSQGARRSAAEEGTAAAEGAEAEVGDAIDAAVSAAGQTAERAREAVDRAIGPATPTRATTGRTSPSSPATSRASSARPAGTPASPAVGDLDRQSTVDEAARALADDLMRIPGIQRFGGMRLADLETTGPRPLRTMWRIARDRLRSEYGELTIGEVIDRYRGGSGGGGGGVSAGA